MNPVTEALQPFIGQWETNPRLGISGNRSRTWGWIFLMLWMHCFRLLCIRGFCGFDFSYQLHPLHSFILFITLVYTYIYYIYNYIYIYIYLRQTTLSRDPSYLQTEALHSTAQSAGTAAQSASVMAGML